MIIHDPSLEEFDSAVSTGLVLVDFWAPWCGPCNMQAPIAEKLSSTHPVTLVKVNVDECGELSDKFGINSIPSLFLYKDGKLIKNFVGLTRLEDLEKAFGL